MPFPRDCLNCEKRFKPNTKWTKLCDGCYEKLKGLSKAKQYRLEKVMIGVKGR